MADTKEKIIALADRLIRTKGFNAFSYKDIAGQLAVKNAAVHYYFPAKGDLGTGVIDAEMQRFARHQAIWKHLPEDEQLRLLLESFRKKSQSGSICLMGSLSPDYDTLPPAMQSKLQELSNAIIQWVAACLEKGREKGLFRFEGHAEDRALLVVSELLSSLLLSRVMGKTVFTRMSNQLLKDLVIKNE